MSVRVYTDGAVSPNGFGGWAAILFVDGAPIDGTYGGLKNTTNNQMELAGLIAGMRLLPLIDMARCSNCGVVPEIHFAALSEHDHCTLLGTIKRPVYPEAVVVSDSQYCVKGATHWVHGWKQNGWKTAQKQDVKNRGLWEEVDKLTRRTCAGFEWVKGHNGDPGNELADAWANEGKAKMYGCSHHEWMSKIPIIGEFPSFNEDG